MQEKQITGKSKWAGIASLIIPPISLLIMVNITNVSEVFGNVLLILTAICFIVPVLFGFFLFYKFAKTKSYLLLLLAILNILSPVWLFMLLMFLVFKDAKDF